MEMQQLISEITTLSASARQELEQFLVDLKWRYAQLAPPTENELEKWRDPEFFGMYADRKDMEDSTEYIRKLRDEQWNKR